MKKIILILLTISVIHTVHGYNKWTNNGRMNTLTYETAPIVKPVADKLITQKAHKTTLVKGNAYHYYDSLRNKSPFKNTVSVANKGNLGLMLRPELSYPVSSKFSINLGAYFIRHLAGNTGNSDYRIADKVGSYSPISNTVSTGAFQSKGLTVGFRMMFGK